MGFSSAKRPPVSARHARVLLEGAVQAESLEEAPRQRLTCLGLEWHARLGEVEQRVHLAPGAVPPEGETRTLAALWRHTLSGSLITRFS